MPLVTYEQVAPFAGLVEYKTSLRDRAGADASLVCREEYRHPGVQGRSLLERRGNCGHFPPGLEAALRKATPANAPEPLEFDDSVKWTAGEPDLVVRMADITKLAGTPDLVGRNRIGAYRADRRPLGQIGGNR